MEESKRTKTNYYGQAPTTISTSSESLPVSSETLTSLVVRKPIINPSESKHMQSFPDAFPLENSAPSSEDVGKKLQGDVVEDSKHSLQQNVLDISSMNPSISSGENIESNHQQGITVDGSKTSVKQDVLDTTSANQNSPTAFESSSVLATDDDDIVVVSLGPLLHQSSHSMEKPKEVLQNSLQESKDSSSAGGVDGHISTASVSIERSKEEEISPVSPILVKPQSNHGNITKNTSESAKSSSRAKQVNPSRGIVDTAAPFESVKEAVTKFGGIVDWKAYRLHTQERRKHVQSELERVQKDIPRYKKQSEAAEEAKSQVLTKLESSKRIIEELKLNLERVQTEEAQAKQDSELAQLRVKELEQGITGEASIAAKAQLEVAKARYEAAVAEIKSVKEELNSLQGDYASLLIERDMAMRKAEEAISASEEIEKTVEALTLELITTKEALESAHAVHLEAEEHNIGASLAKDQDCRTWEKELKQAEEEVERLNQQLLSTNDLKSKIDIASTLLLNLKAELAGYMKSKLKQESEITEEEKLLDDAKNDKKSQVSSQALVATKKELEEVKASIDKSKDEVNILQVAYSSLKSELDREKAALLNLQQREGMASVAVSSLEAELDKTKRELELVTVKEKEARNKMMELPKLLQQAAQEADQAKSVAQLAREELRKAKEEAEQAKACATTTAIKLNAALKETEAAKASERLALATIKALEESEQASSPGGVDPSTGVTLSLDEYFNLSKQAHEAETLSHERVEFAIAQIQVAKDSESKSLARLKEVYRDRDRCKEALSTAMEKAEKAKEGKLGVEQELRNWRAEHERQRKANDAAKNSVSPLTSLPGSVTHSGELKSLSVTHSGELKGLKKEGNDVLVHAVLAGSFKRSSESKSLKKEENDVLIQAAPDEKLYISESSPESVKPKKKKRSLFRILMFLIKKKHQSTK